MERENFNNENKEQEINLKKIIYKVIGNWYFFVISLFVTLSIAFFVTKHTKSTYKINSSILIKDKENAMVGGVESIIEELGFRRSRRKSVENEMVILKSYDLIYRTIQELDWGVSYYSFGRINTIERYKSSPYLVEFDTSFEQKAGLKVFINFLSDKKFRLEVDGDSKSTVLYLNEEYNSALFKFKIVKKPFS
jgi:tyrosine-protein kinase Etk/Wzc